jgi:hypothetical protein
MGVALKKIVTKNCQSGNEGKFFDLLEEALFKSQ